MIINHNISAIFARRHVKFAGRSKDIRIDRSGNGKFGNSLTGIDSGSMRFHTSANQNSLEFTARRLMVASENTQSSENRIRDIATGKAMLNFIRSQVLMRSSVALLAQANLKPSSVLELLE